MIKNRNYTALIGSHSLSDLARHFSYF